MRPRVIFMCTGTLCNRPPAVAAPWTETDTSRGPASVVYGEMLHAFCYHWTPLLARFLITVTIFSGSIATYGYIHVDLRGLCLQVTILGNLHGF